AAILNALHTYLLLLPALLLYSWLHPDFFGSQLSTDGIWWLFPITDVIAALVIALYSWYFIKRLQTNFNF
ncbi:MAG TPA: hypothetical protein DIC30_08790, partial [Oceanospirillales bacterium]|nr:hypothetical protein [Oceanospirillales bacterium]